MRNASTNSRSLLLSFCAALGTACGDTSGDDPSQTMTTAPAVTTPPMVTTPPVNPQPTGAAPPVATTPVMTTAPGTTTTSPTTTTEPTTTSPTTTEPTTTADPTTTEPTTTTGEMTTAPQEPLEAMTFDEVRTFLDTGVAGSSSCFDCHHVPEGGETPDLPPVFNNDETLYDTLMTKEIARCGNRKLVVPGDPASSALYLVMEGECDQVGKMPKGCVEDEYQNTCMDAQDRERLRLWIEAGAPQ